MSLIQTIKTTYAAYGARYCALVSQLLPRDLGNLVGKYAMLDPNTFFNEILRDSIFVEVSSCRMGVHIGFTSVKLTVESSNGQRRICFIAASTMFSHDNMKWLNIIITLLDDIGIEPFNITQRVEIAYNVDEHLATEYQRRAQAKIDSLCT